MSTNAAAAPADDLQRLADCITDDKGLRRGLRNQLVMDALLHYHLHDDHEALANAIINEPELPDDDASPSGGTTPLREECIDIKAESLAIANALAGDASDDQHEEESGFPLPPDPAASSGRTPIVRAQEPTNTVSSATHLPHSDQFPDGSTDQALERRGPLQALKWLIYTSGAPSRCALPPHCSY